MSTQTKDQLFILAAPFADGVDDAGAPRMWFCRDCATIEGALIANPHWSECVDVRRVAFPRPRPDVVALIGEENQELPCIVLAEASGEHKHASGRAFINDLADIVDYLSATYGGAGRHP